MCFHTAVYILTSDMWASQKQTKGFTIVELLIVIVVIAILAAISIVAYNGIQNRARASAATSALNQAQKKIFIARNDGTLSAYPEDQTVFDSLGITSSGVTYQYIVPSTNPTGYCITATVGTISYKIAETGQASNGSCNGHAGGGAQTITNLATNPRVTTANRWSTRSSTGGNPNGTLLTGVNGIPAPGVTTAYRSTLAGTPSSWWRVNYGTTSVNSSTQYTLSIYGRPSVDTSTSIVTRWFNSANSLVQESSSTAIAQTAGSWERRSISLTSPATAVNVHVEFSASSAGQSGAYLDASAIMIQAGLTITSYGDGATTLWDWNGAANDATSSGPSA